MTEKKTRARGLGRGLSALMADVAAPTEVAVETDGQKRPDMVVPIERVFPNPDQPRRTFTKDQLDDLAASIREKGIIQPLIVRVRPSHPEDFEIVAGERRWRAAQIAQLHHLPVLVRDFDDTEVLEIAIIENIQRADLNPIEEAAGYRQLMDKFGHTQEKLSIVLGKSRSHIANLMRLLQLPDPVQNYLREGHLTAGHARALITADDPVALAKTVIKKGLSVRETERLSKQAEENIFSGGKSTKRPTSSTKDADTKALEDDLTTTIGMQVAINHHPGQESGQLTISYTSLDELDELCRILSSTH